MRTLSWFTSPARAAAGAIVASLVLAPAAGAFVGERVVSPGGIEAWLVQAPGVPVISIDFSFRGGAALDPDGKEGLAELATYLLDEGAGDLDSRAFQGALTANSISLDFSADRDRFFGSMYTLSANRDLAFQLLAKALTAPRFDAEPLERMRGALLADLSDELADPGAIATRAWWAAAFPDHPYGRPRTGTPESVAAITDADLRMFVQSRFARDNLSIGVVGSVTAGELGPLLDATFGALPEHAGAWTLPDVDMQGGGEVLLVDVALPQTIFVFGQPGPDARSHEFHAVNVVNYLLGGGGFASRLTTEIRERRGLTYNVQIWPLGLESTGLIIGRTSTVNERAGETLQVLLEQWRLMAAEGPTPGEVDGARLYLNGAYPLGYTDTPSIASALRQYQELGFPPNYYDIRHERVDAVTPEIATETAQRWLDAEKLLVVVVGQPVGITPTRTAGEEIKGTIGLTSTTADSQDAPQ